LLLQKIGLDYGLTLNFGHTRKFQQKLT